MARIRSIFPNQWTDDGFVSCSPLARLLAIALRNEADDQGIFEWKPTSLKMRLLPGDAADIVPLLEELLSTKQVMRFEAEGRSFGAIRNFMIWQRPKKPTSSHPCPERVAAWVGMGRKKSPTNTEDSPDQYDTSSEQVPNQTGNHAADRRREEVGGNSLSRGGTLSVREERGGANQGETYDEYSFDEQTGEVL